MVGKEYPKFRGFRFEFDVILWAYRGGLRLEYDLAGGVVLPELGECVPDLVEPVDVRDGELRGAGCPGVAGARKINLGNDGYVWGSGNYKILDGLFSPLLKTLAMRSDFLMLYEQLGVFSYMEDGFTVRLGEGVRKYLYGNIETIIAYKIDREIYDEVRMEVVFGDCALRIAECVPGWYQFVIRLKEALPGIPKDWELQMSFPPFAMDLVVLYKR